ncbi:acid protease [Rostrohypoxylon terebratum]|nr:acid protease [Rostrohypoxylon terebratum]
MWTIFYADLIIPILTVYATQCNEIRPFQVPIRDVQVIPENPSSFMQGIPATIGTPPQDIVLLPWPELNNTLIYDKGYCNPDFIPTDDKCRVWRGGYFREDVSSTWVGANNIIAADGAPSEVENEGLDTGKLISSSRAGTDKLEFKAVDGLADFPVGIPTINWDNGRTMLHAMGMGANSTILNSLYEAGRIGSRVWSIFWGRMWVDDGSAMDGSVVFGGYDQQKTAGIGYTQSLDFSENSGCWTGMKVHISGITLHDSYEQDIALLDMGEQLVACIIPQHQLLLNVPWSIAVHLATFIGSEPVNVSWGLHRGAYQFNASDTFTGDLTISLSTGLEVRIPNSQWLVPFVDIDNNGSRVFDTHKRELLVGSLLTNSICTLGRYFLTAAYLMIDLDANNFTIWQANPTSDSKLVGVGNNGCGNETFPNSGASESEDLGALSRLPGGSIAGITVGAIAGLTISSLNNTKTLPSLVNESHGAPVVVSEVSGQSQCICEMDGSTPREG